MPGISPRYQETLDQHRRQVIVDAARRVFEQSGLEGASVRAIAHVAGCTTGAIYPHFPSKEALFATILGESLTAIAFEVKRAMDVSASPTKALRRGTLALYKYYDTHPSDLVLALAVFSGDRKVKLGRELDTNLKQKFDALLELLGDPVGRIAKKSFRPMIRVEASALVTYLVGLLVLKHGSRIDVIGSTAPVLLAHYTKNLVARLTSDQ